jgi:hypothetical protein
MDNGQRTKDEGGPDGIPIRIGKRQRMKDEFDWSSFFVLLFFVLCHIRGGETLQAMDMQAFTTRRDVP